MEIQPNNMLNKIIIGKIRNLKSVLVEVKNKEKIFENNINSIKNYKLEVSSSAPVLDLVTGLTTFHCKRNVHHETFNRPQN
jgi:hypothetical protein